MDWASIIIFKLTVWVLFVHLVFCLLCFLSYTHYYFLRTSERKEQHISLKLCPDAVLPVLTGRIAPTKWVNKSILISCSIKNTVGFPNWEGCRKLKKSFLVLKNFLRANYYITPLQRKKQRNTYLWLIRVQGLAKLTWQPLQKQIYLLEWKMHASSGAPKK